MKIGAKQHDRLRTEASRKRSAARSSPFHQRLRTGSDFSANTGGRLAGTSAYLSGTGQIVQTKLRIGAPNDKYEQEADAVANQVVSASSHALVARPPAIQRWDGKTGVQSQQQSGQHLLAHELTHTVQQGGEGRRLSSRLIQRKLEVKGDAKDDFLTLAGNLSGLKLIAPQGIVSYEEIQPADDPAKTWFQNLRNKLTESIGHEKEIFINATRNSKITDEIIFDGESIEDKDDPLYGSVDMNDFDILTDKPELAATLIFHFLHEKMEEDGWKLRHKAAIREELAVLQEAHSGATARSEVLDTNSWLRIPWKTDPDGTQHEFIRIFDYGGGNQGYWVYFVIVPGDINWINKPKGVFSDIELKKRFNLKQDF